MKPLPMLTLAALVAVFVAGDAAQGQRAQRPRGGQALPAPGAAVALDSHQQKYSYCIGMDVAQRLAEQKLELDVESFIAGLTTMLEGREPVLSAEEIQATMDQFFAEAEQRAAAERDAAVGRNQQEAAEFFAKNKTQEGVVTTASGLQYKVVQPGAGASPKPTDLVTVHYRGTLLSGEVFDTSLEARAEGLPVEPATFPANGVIAGWQEALQLMKPGAVYKLWIPAELAYGDAGAGDMIGPGAALVFDVQLLKVQPGR